MDELPVNCLFNKKQTGCGATELAIRNSIPTIIAMPYVALVKNKTIYRKDAISVLGVYEGIWKIQCKLPPKTKAILPPCAKIILPP